MSALTYPLFAQAVIAQLQTRRQSSSLPGGEFRQGGYYRRDVVELLDALTDAAPVAPSVWLTIPETDTAEDLADGSRNSTLLSREETIAFAVIVLAESSRNAFEAATGTPGDAARAGALGLLQAVRDLLHNWIPDDYADAFNEPIVLTGTRQLPTDRKDLLCHVATFVARVQLDDEYDEMEIIDAVTVAAVDPGSDDAIIETVITTEDE